MRDIYNLLESLIIAKTLDGSIRKDEYKIIEEQNLIKIKKYIYVTTDEFYFIYLRIDKYYQTYDVSFNFIIGNVKDTILKKYLSKEMNYVEHNDISRYGCSIHDMSKQDVLKMIVEYHDYILS